MSYASVHIDVPPTANRMWRNGNTLVRWGILWQSESKLDGKVEHVMWRDGHPLLFKSRHAARAYIRGNWGYIARRPDLRAEPHGWKVPKPVRVRVDLAWEAVQ